MKKVLVATIVATMLVAGATGASAAPVSTARASAFGVDVSGDLLNSLIEREPFVVSELPPGGVQQDDIIDLDLGPIAREAVAFVQAETSVESTIIPVLGPDSQRDGRGGSGLLGGGDGGSLLGGGGGGSLLGGGGGDGGSLLGGGGGSLLGGGGGRDNVEGENIRFSGVNARGFAIVDLTGALIDESRSGGSGGSGLLGGGGDGSSLLGDLLGGSGSGGMVTPDDVLNVVIDALLTIQVIQAEAVAVCTGSTVEFDVASRLIDDQGSDIEIGDLLDDIVSGLFDLFEGGEGDRGILSDLVRITEGTDPGGSGTTADGGVFVNGLRVEILPSTSGGGGSLLGGGGDGDGSSLLGGGDGGSLLGGGGDGSSLLGSLLGGGGDGGRNQALIDITLAHAEVSGTAVCAQQAAPPAAPPLPPSGDVGTLPVTGGGLGVLPAVLGLGLAGGAVGDGRLALRSRKEHIVS